MIGAGVRAPKGYDHGRLKELVEHGIVGMDDKEESLVRGEG